MKILEYHNWSAAEHILVFRAKGDEVFLPIHYAQVNNERFKSQNVAVVVAVKKTTLEMFAKG